MKLISVEIGYIWKSRAKAKERKEKKKQDKKHTRRLKGGKEEENVKIRKN